MKNKTFEIYYDTEADILEIQIGKPTECYFDEISDDVFEGHDEKTGTLKGFKIFNFSKRERVDGKIKLPLPLDKTMTY